MTAVWTAEAVHIPPFKKIIGYNSVTMTAYALERIKSHETCRRIVKACLISRRSAGYFPFFTGFPLKSEGKNRGSSGLSWKYRSRTALWSETARGTAASNRSPNDSVRSPFALCHGRCSRFLPEGGRARGRNRRLRRPDERGGHAAPSEQMLELLQSAAHGHAAMCKAQNMPHIVHAAVDGGRGDVRTERCMHRLREHTGGGFGKQF